MITELKVSLPTGLNYMHDDASLFDSAVNAWLLDGIKSDS